jgi:hypothetical protein
MRIEKEIRKKLIEKKSKRDEILIQERLFTKRVNLIFETENNIKNFESLNEAQKVKLSFKLIQELNEQSINGVVNESITEFIQKIFGTTAGATVGQTILEPALNFILGGLGMGDTPLKKFVISFLSKKEGFWNVFKDCDTATKMIAESIVEAFAMEATQRAGVGGKWESALRNAIGDASTKNAMVSNVEKQIVDTVCEFFGKASKNAKNVYDKLSTDVTDLIPAGS